MKLLPTRGKRAWSLIELTIILVVLSILCAILAPVIDRFVRNAKVVRAREDVQSIGCCIWMFIEDTANSYFLEDGSKDRNGGGSIPDQSVGNRVKMLVSDGDIPELRNDLQRAAPTGSQEWVKEVGRSDMIDFLEYHLVTNNPFDSDRNAYRTPLDYDNQNTGDPTFARDESGGFNSEFSWRGPYMTAPIDPDPWGNRYAVNVKYLDPIADSDPDDPAGNQATQGGCGYTYDTVVISAGPDEEIDTLYAVDGLTPGDDDIMYTISGNSRP